MVASSAYRTSFHNTAAKMQFADCMLDMDYFMRKIADTLNMHLPRV